jgi:hypothetical protein
VSDRPTSDPIDLPAGARQVRLSTQVPSGTWVRVRLETRGEDGEWVETAQVRLGDAKQARYQPAVLAAWTKRLGALRRDWDFILLWFALGLYLALRLIALPSFPIYFFSDEAIQTVLAADLVRDGLRGYDKVFLPTYFPNAGQYNLSLSVYLQLLPYLAFGKSVWITRGVPALISLIAALAVGLALRRAFDLKRAWLGVLALAAAPVWLLHSRTAFETSLAVTFYAAFLASYLIYRSGRLRWIYAAVAFGALSFYSYAPAQIVAGATALLLFFSDLGYHWKQRRSVLPALGAAVLFALPYIRHQIVHPTALQTHLSILDSYLTTNLPLAEKLVRAGTIYLRGLDPVYWFLPNPVDLPRHRMADWGHLLRWTFPFFTAGLGVALWNIRRSEYRALLLAFLACPLGAVPVGMGVTRVLFYVVPASLFIALGFDLFIRQAARWRVWLGSATAASSLAALALASGALFVSALRDGPLWFRDYGLGGMQWGAAQVFGVIQEELKANPDRPIILSPTWANATDVLRRYFLPEEAPVRLAGLRTYSENYTPFPPETLFIFPPEDYRVIPPEMFSSVDVERILLYPDGNPGFYFLRLGYAPDAEEVLARLRAERAAPVEESITLEGVEVLTRHTRLDIGEIKTAFDGDPDSLLRTEIANPMVIELFFPAPRELRGVSLRVGGVPTRLRIRAIMSETGEQAAWETSLPESQLPREAEVEFEESLKVDALRIEVLNANDGPEAHVHLWEIWLK